MATELESLGGYPLINPAVVPEQGSETGHCQRQSSSWLDVSTGEHCQAASTWEEEAAAGCLCAH